MPIEREDRKGLPPGPESSRALGHPDYAATEVARPCWEPEWLTHLAKRRPDFVMMAPFMAYLVLLPLGDLVPKAYLPWALAAKGVGGLAIFWLLRRHMPPLGRAHWPVAILTAVAATVLWVGGQHLFNHLDLFGKSLGDRFFLLPGARDVADPRIGISAFSWWSQVTLRLAVTAITVPIVEEIFWRGFLLRAFINWDRFETIPLGTFAWRAFLGTALLSVVQHPDNWGVSIFCWLLYNGVMYWKKSLLCLMIVHGLTNLLLYTYVIKTGDWQFW
jgi:CAAX prenyl protease-like protein